MKNMIIGIDVGTSGTKAVLYDNKGHAHAEHTEHYGMRHPYDDWAEQHPDLWWQSTVAAIQTILKKSAINSQDVVGIGLTGQMHGLVLLDKNNQVLRDAILWCDQRTKDEYLRLNAQLGEDVLVYETGNPAVPGFTASKILWVKRHEPDLFAKTRHILLPKDYVRYKLTGNYVTDVSDASGTQLLSINQRTWSKRMLDALGLDASVMGEVMESDVVSGTLTAEASDLTGLSMKTIVSAGAGDQAAAAIGKGMVDDKQLGCNIGTSGVVFAATHHPFRDPSGSINAFCHAKRDMWHLMGVTQAAGLSVEWFKHHLFNDPHDTTSGYEAFNHAIASVPPGAAGLMYLPYLMGERSPHPNPLARGVFFGLSPEHTRSHMARAVIEGVSHSLLDCLYAIRDLGLEFDRVLLSGGGAKSGPWRQILADMFGKPIMRSDTDETGTLGAAMLASVAAGLHASLDDAVRVMVKTSSAETPDLTLSKFYEARHALYQRLYHDLKIDFDMLQHLRHPG